MNSYANLGSSHVERMAFIETLSRELFATTGLGLYAYFATVDVDRLFQDYRTAGGSIRSFVRQCLRNP